MIADGPVEGVQAPEAAAPESDEEVLDAEELLAYKKHIIELLQPGETVPNAIRRLGERLLLYRSVFSSGFLGLRGLGRCCCRVGGEDELMVRP